MYAQLSYFDGPRSPELVAAGQRAGNERINPLMAANPVTSAAHRATYVLARPDGGSIVMVVVATAEALEVGRDIIRSSELLPGEDPALLPCPDRVEVLEVAHAFDADFAPMQVPA